MHLHNPFITEGETLQPLMLILDKREIMTNGGIYSLNLAAYISINKKTKISNMITECIKALLGNADFELYKNNFIDAFDSETQSFNPFSFHDSEESILHILHILDKIYSIQNAIEYGKSIFDKKEDSQIEYNTTCNT